MYNTRHQRQYCRVVGHECIRTSFAALASTPAEGFDQRSVTSQFMVVFCLCVFPSLLFSHPQHGINNRLQPAWNLNTCTALMFLQPDLVNVQLARLAVVFSGATALNLRRCSELTEEATGELLPGFRQLRKLDLAGCRWVSQAAASNVFSLTRVSYP